MMNSYIGKNNGGKPMVEDTMSAVSTKGNSNFSEIKLSVSPLYNAVAEIFTTFYAANGELVCMKRLHQKIITLATGEQALGFFTTFNEKYASVKTDCFVAILKKVNAFVGEPPHGDNPTVKSLWEIKPVKVCINTNAVGNTDSDTPPLTLTTTHGETL